MAVLRTEGAHIHPYLCDILRAQSPTKLRLLVKKNASSVAKDGLRYKPGEIPVEANAGSGLYRG
jgi:hypothetical protein